MTKHVSGGRAVTRAPETRRSRRDRGRAALAVAVIVPISLLCGCAVFSTPTAASGPTLASPESAQSELMSFVSTFVATITQQWNAAAVQQTAAGTPPVTPGTPPPPSVAAPPPPSPATTRLGPPTASAERTPAERARRAALETKNANISNAIAIATGPNPLVGVGDMITLVTLQRMLLQSPQTEATYGPERAAALVAAYQAQEAAAWRMGARVYTQTQLDQLRELIALWRRENPGARYIAGVRLEDFARDRRLSISTVPQKNESLLALVGLDPLSNLDPTTREVERSRLLAERVFFYTQYAPQIFKGQTESLYLQFLSTPEARRALASFDQAADALDEMGRVADDLPAVLAKERSEAIQQLFAELRIERQEALLQVAELIKAERRALLADLDTRQGGLRDTLGELRQTVQAAESLSASVRGTIKQADELMSKVAPPAEEAAGPASPVAAGASETPDSLEKYQSAMAQTATTADKLTILVDRIDRILSSPSLDAKAGGMGTIVGSLQSGVEETGRRAFWGLLALAIVTAALFGAALMLALSGHKAWERRRIVKHLRRHGRPIA